jgi:hypothetical protein
LSYFTRYREAVLFNYVIDEFFVTTIITRCRFVYPALPEPARVLKSLAALWLAADGQARHP